MDTIPIKGIDVSNWQGNINWATVAKSGVAFAYAKATEWTEFVDPSFVTNVTNAKRAGVHVGAYHFAHPTSDPIAEANHFLSVYTKVETDLLPMLDLELPGTNVASWAQKWIDHVRSKAGHDVLVYASPSYIQSYRLQPLVGHKLWIADYGVSSPACAPWPAWTLWQHSQTGAVAGIVGNVDMDLAVSLDALLKDVPVAHPASSPPATPSLATLPIAERQSLYRQMVSFLQKLLKVSGK